MQNLTVSKFLALIMVLSKPYKDYFQMAVLKIVPSNCNIKRALRSSLVSHSLWVALYDLSLNICILVNKDNLN